MTYIVRPDTISNIISSISQRLFTLETYRSNNPCARLWGNGGQVLTNATDATTALQNTSFIQGGMVLSGYKIVVPISGFYQVNGVWAATAVAGSAVARIWVNGVQTSRQQVIIGTTSPSTVSVSDIVQLNSGDIVSLISWQSTGASMTTPSSGSSPGVVYLSIALLSA